MLAAWALHGASCDEIPTSGYSLTVKFFSIFMPSFCSDWAATFALNVGDPLATICGVLGQTFGMPWTCSKSLRPVALPGMRLFHRKRVSA